MSEVLAYEAFLTRVAYELEVDPEQLRAGPLEDAGFDSLRFFELEMLVEDLGVYLTEDELAGMHTLADVYQRYSLAAADPERLGRAGTRAPGE